MLSPATVATFKNAVLGRRYELSVAVVGRAEMKKYNAAYRQIAKPTDILSFPFSKNSGEILICIPEVKTHAKAFGMSYADYLPYLLIHGLVHLKGHDHGRIMDSLELRYTKALKVVHPSSLEQSNGTTNRSGSRRRHISRARRSRTRGRR